VGLDPETATPEAASARFKEFVLTATLQAFSGVGAGPRY